MEVVIHSKNLKNWRMYNPNAVFYSGILTAYLCGYKKAKR